MRVGQLGRNVQPEGVVVVDGRVAHLEQRAPLVVVHRLREHRLERRVERLPHVLEQHGAARAHRRLERAQQVLLARTHDRQLPVGALERAQPLVRLPLGVDGERPPLALGGEDAILRRVVVDGQAHLLPLADDDGLTHALDEVEVVARLGSGEDAFLRASLRPGVEESPAVLRGEGARVRDEGGRDEDRAGQPAQLHLESARRLSPAHRLLGEATRQLVGRDQPARGGIGRVLQLLLLDHRRVARRLELVHLLDDSRELLLDQLQLILLGLERHLRVGHQHLLGLHHLRHVVVHLHGAAPEAERARRERDALDDFGLEVGLIVVAVDLLDHLGRDVVLVKVHQRLEQVRVAQDLLGRVPVGLLAEQDAHALHHLHHQRRRLGVPFHLDQVRLRQRLERRDGRLEGWQRLVEVGLRVVGKRAHLLGRLRHERLVALDQRLLLRGRLRLALHLDQQLGGLNRLGLEHGLQLRQLDLHVGDGLVGLLELMHAALEPLEPRRHLLPLVVQHRHVKGQQLEERLWRHVRAPPLLVEEGLRHRAHRSVHEGGERAERAPRGLVLLHGARLARAREDLVRDRLQRVLGPRVIPVDGRAVCNARAQREEERMGGR